MRSSKRLVVLAFMLLLVALTTIGCKKNPSEGKVQAELALGYDGTIKIDADNPLIAIIKNDGPAFQGELQVVVEDTGYSKVIIAMPFEIAENSQKEISMDVPVYMIQKKFEVSIVTEGDKVFEETLKINKILSPEKNVMAVITDTPDTYRFIENTPISNYVNPNYNTYLSYSSGMKMGMTVVEGQTESKEMEVFYFDSLEEFNTVEKLSFFNFIFIGHNQSLTINEEQEKNLLKWLEKGNGLILDAGADYQKLKAILPESLYPVPITEVIQADLPIGYSDSTLTEKVELAKSDSIPEGTEFFGDQENYLYARTKVGNGTILTLFVNLGLEPLASWTGKSSLLSNLMANGFVIDMSQGYYVDPYYNPYQNQVASIPSDKEPPYIFMIVLFVVYIILVAPILYIVLKKLDKRDLAWIAIPALSLISVLILFIVGEGTKYQNPIVNTFSIVTANENDSLMKVESNIAIFSDLKDELSIEWNKEDAFKFTNNYVDPYMIYSADPSLENNQKELNGKMTIGAMPKYELYNTSLWMPNFASAKKMIPFEVEKMVTLQLQGDHLEIIVKNTTPYDLQKAFVEWGNGYIAVGDLAVNEEKTVTKKISELQSKIPEEFFQELLDYKPDYSNSYRPNIDVKKQQLLDLLLQKYVYEKYNYQVVAMTDIMNVKLCGVNNQHIGYELVVNGDEPDYFSTNLMEFSSTVEFEKGSSITIPSNMMQPTITYALDEDFNAIGSYNFQPYDQFVFYYEKGIALYTFAVPQMLEMNSAHIEFSDLFTENEYYNLGAGIKSNPLKGVTYHIYNCITDAYEEIDKEFDITLDYISKEGLITLQANFLEIDVNKGLNNSSPGYVYAFVSKMPTLTIEGSVK